MLLRPIGSLSQTLLSAHDKYGRDITLDELYDLHLANNPALTVAQKNNLDILFGELYDTPETGADIADDIIQKLAVREQARQVAQACVEVMNGKCDNFGNVLSILDTCPISSDLEELTAVTDDVEKVLDEAGSGVRWHYNIPELRERAGGGGPGIFTIIAARPEIGKTAAHVSFACSPQGFCSQGANVHGIINEEKAVRTKLRAIAACSGMAIAEIKKSPKKAEEAWAQIKGRYHLFDAVGITASRLDAHVKKHKPDILIVDQLDKMVVEGRFNNEHERLRAVYTAGREIAKGGDTWLIGISQLSAEAEGKSEVTYAMLEGSKTGKAAEADQIMCIGARPELHGDRWRVINLPKNKITGDHGQVTCSIDPQTSRYYV